MPRLIEWDSFELRVAGARINELAAPLRIAPLERLKIDFANGLIRVEGSVRRFISVPFTIEIAELPAGGTVVRVPVRSASAFGGIPIPRFLFGLVKERLPRDLVTFEPPATFVVALDRFLPEFVLVDIQRIWIIDGGLAVTIGRGGADLPIRVAGGPNDRGF